MARTAEARRDLLIAKIRSQTRARRDGVDPARPGPDHEIGAGVAHVVEGPFRVGLDRGELRRAGEVARSITAEHSVE
jgi:hypothetical protein